MKKLLITISSLFLLSCQDDNEFTHDGFKDEYTVKYIIAEHPEQVRNLFNKINNGSNGITDVDSKSTIMLGFSYNKNNICHIVIADPNHMSIKETENLIGHENLHCMFGRWHMNRLKYPKVKYDFNFKGK